MATSGTITVVAAAPSVTVSPATVNPGGAIAVTVANGAGYASDWVGLYATSAPDSTYLAWQFLNGTTMPPATGMTSATLQFPAPMTAGTYNVRLFANNGKSIKIATSGPVSVQLSTLQANAASVAKASTSSVAKASTSSSSSLGAFDTPADNAIEVAGAIPVTGWALDDTGIVEVQLWRNCVEAIDRPAGACSASTPGGPTNFVFVANASFLAGARSDVETSNPANPQSYRAGWGYLLSTNALPHLILGTKQGGQGTFTLSAYAVNVDNRHTLLGTKTITLGNDTATRPFGSIDTPGQHPAATPSIYANVGWAMTQDGKCIDTTATARYRVYIDGVSMPLTLGANWFPGPAGADIAAALPRRCDSSAAQAAYYVDVNGLGLADGLHTTGWDVTDGQGNVGAIGSRFFTVRAGSVVAPESATSARVMALGVARDLDASSKASRSVLVRAGRDDVPMTTVTLDASGRYRVQFAAGSRIALDLGGKVDAGYQIVGDELRALPSGSTFDATSGQLTWQPPVPFLGAFHLVFTSGSERIDVMATIVDPTAAR